MCGVKMKLCLPFFCVALLSVGIMPVAVAESRSFSDDTNLNRTEAEPELAQIPLSPSISPESEGSPQPPALLAPEVLPDRPLLEKSEVKSRKFTVKLPVPSEGENLNSHSYLAPSHLDAPKTPTPNLLSADPQPLVQTAEIGRLNDIEQPSTSASVLLQQPVSRFTNFSDVVQLSQSVVQVTGVRLNPTAAGLEVILETAAGEVLEATTRTSGKTLIADIPSAQLALPEGKEFRADNPSEKITSVTVTQVDANRIQVSITGKTAVPIGQVVRGDRGLVLSVTPVNSDELEIVVSATRTEEIIENIPRSVTVITRREIEEQTPVSRSLQDIVGREVPGLGPSTQSRSQFGQNLRGRGISVLIDGVPLTTNTQPRGLQTLAPNAIERIEVVRGPNAIYGSQATGGTINIITRRPSENTLSQQSEVGLTAAAGNQRFLESGSFGNYISHSLSGTEGAYNYALSFSRESTGTFYDAEGDRIFNNRPLDQSATFNVLAKAGVNLDSRQRLQLTFNHYRSS